jgi:hypothetical protein
VLWATKCSTESVQSIWKKLKMETLPVFSRLEQERGPENRE